MLFNFKFIQKNSRVGGIAHFLIYKNYENILNKILCKIAITVLQTKIIQNNDLLKSILSHFYF